MSFKHKLSVRLALMKRLRPLVLLAGLCACERPVSLAGPGSAVTRVVVSPRQVALLPNETSQFMAVGLSAAGDTGNVPVTWSATGGSIVDTFSIGSRHYATYQPSVVPGNYLVIATDPPATALADTGVVTVMPVAAGSTYYVSPTGSDANAGTVTAPFRTIQRAANLVSPGDVVIVEDGVYTDTDSDGSIVTIARGGTAAAVVTFRARNKWMAKLDGQNGVAWNAGFYVTNGVGYVRIEGFEIYGVANIGLGPSGRGSASGIDTYAGGHDSQIVGNHIHDIGRVCTLETQTNGLVGIYVDQPNVTIEQNVIHDIGRLSPGENGCTYPSGWTIYQSNDHGIYHSAGDNLLVRNNLFYNNFHGWSIQEYPSARAGVRILNNTFAFGNPYSRQTHIVLGANFVGSGNLIANNVFYETTSASRPIHFYSFSGSLTLQNNLASGAAMTDADPVTGITYTGNILSRDARLVNPASADFHLQAGSPAIDAGLTLLQVLLDFDGVPRPRGAGYDIGAYEF